MQTAGYCPKAAWRKAKQAPKLPSAKAGSVHRIGRQTFAGADSETLNTLALLRMAPDFAGGGSVGRIVEFCTGPDQRHFRLTFRLSIFPLSSSRFPRDTSRLAKPEYSGRAPFEAQAPCR